MGRLEKGSNMFGVPWTCRIAPVAVDIALSFFPPSSAVDVCGLCLEGVCRAIAGVVSSHGSVEQTKNGPLQLGWW